MASIRTSPSVGASRNDNSSSQADGGVDSQPEPDKRSAFQPSDNQAQASTSSQIPNIMATGGQQDRACRTPGAGDLEAETSSHTSVQTAGLQQGTSVSDSRSESGSSPPALTTNDEHGATPQGSRNGSNDQLSQDEFLADADSVQMGGDADSGSQVLASNDAESLRSSREGNVNFFPPVTSKRGLIPFTNIASRGPALDYTTGDSVPIGMLRLLTTTREDLAHWLVREQSPKLTENCSMGPVSSIFVIVHYDTLDFLRSIEDFLDGALAASNDEVSLERNIQLWRKLIHVSAVELGYLSKEIPQFVEYVCRPSGIQDSRQIKSISLNLVEEIHRVQKRLDKTFHALVSSMSVVESRRGIAEAESVTKLTELGGFISIQPKSKLLSLTRGIQHSYTFHSPLLLAFSECKSKN